MARRSGSSCGASRNSDVGAVTETSPGQFQVKFDALGGLLQRVLGGRPAVVDPYTAVPPTDKDMLALVATLWW